MNVGILMLRLVVGLTMAAHGSQKLFGWFGGRGFAATVSFLGEMGFRPGGLHAALAGGSELAGGLLLALGLLTPLGTAAVTGSMAAAIATVTGKGGFFLANDGFEYNLLLVASALAIGFTGPGRFSFDRVLGWSLSGARWGIAAGLVGIVTAAGVVAVRHPPAPLGMVPQGQDATDVGMGRGGPLTRIVLMPAHEGRELTLFSRLTF